MPDQTTTPPISGACYQHVHGDLEQCADSVPRCGCDCHTDGVDYLTWDHREQIPMGELTAVLGRHGLTVTEVDTGSDQYAIRISSAPDETAEEVLAAHERGEKGVTAPPPPRVEATGVALTENATTTTADPTHGRIDRDIQAAVDDWGPTSVGQRVAIENTLQEQRDSGREPLTTPAEAAQESPADPDPHPDTPDSVPGILGRALLDQDGDLWWQEGAMWRQNGGGLAIRSKVEERYGPVREVLLVDPAAAHVIQAAQQWRAMMRGGDDPALWADETDLALIAAVDALTGGPGQDTPVELDLPCTVDGCRQDRPCPEHDAADTPADPEPAGDGPGWQRDRITELAEKARPDDDGLPGYPALGPADADQLTALLADHVRVAAERLREHNRAERAEHEREQIRQELIEVKSDMVARIRERDRYRAERDKALRLVHMRDTEQAAHEGELGDMRAKLSAAEVEIDELRELTATCGCGDGNPETYEGPQPDCPVHGTVRAFNEASRELAELREQLEHARADRQDLWDTRDKRNHRWMEAAERYQTERDTARAELAAATAEQERLHGVAERAMAERRRRGVELEQLRSEQDRLRDQLQDAAADALDAFAAWLPPRWSAEARQQAAEIRTGQRDTPGTEEQP